jgi:hypothetical protein
MTHPRLLSFIVIGAMAGGTMLAYAQQPPEAAKPAPTAPATPATDAAAPAAATAPNAATQTPAAPAAATPAAPSAETLKKARQAGFHPEVSNGVTLFCQKDASLGTRFPTKKCLNEAQLNSTLALRQDVRDSMQQPGACGAGCSGH